MKKIFIALLALACTLPAVAQEAENYIQVTGTSEVEIVPNQFYLSITLDESDTKGRLPLETQRRQMVSALKSLGIDTEKALSIANISNSYYKRSTSLDVAKYQLLLTTPEQLTAVFDKLGSLGISNIAIERVSHTDIERYKSECRKQAMVNAKQIATELAEAIGQQIGKCIYIYDANRGLTPTYYNDGLVLARSASKVMAEQTPEEPIAFKKIKLSYSVNAKFRL